MESNKFDILLGREREMTCADAIRALLKESKKSQMALAEELGYARASSINNMIASGNVEMNTMVRICDALGYEISVQPKRQRGARPDGQIVIDEVVPNGKKRGRPAKAKE